MNNSIFSSIGLTICSTIFAILITYMFITNKKKKERESKLFLILMILIIVLIGLEFATSFTIPHSNDLATLNKILCYSYVYTMILWDEVMLGYITTIILSLNDKLMTKCKKRTIIILSVVIVALIIPLLVISLFQVEWTAGVNGSPHVIGGTAIMVAHMISTIGSFGFLVIASIYREKIRNLYSAPFYTLFIIYISVLLLQMFINYEINDVTIMFTAILAIAFFTIENQDNKLLYEYKKSKAEAEKANKAKTEFLINMSHEIRTPMNTILGFGDSLLKEQTLTEDIARRDLQSINSAADTLNDLINNILDISRIESGEEEVNNADYDLENLIFEINSLIPSKINKEELKFSIDINENIPKSYNGDARKLYKIITYILLNAIDYTNYGEVKLTVDGQALQDGMFEFNFLVSNTGHAMTNELFNSKFDDYVKIERASQNNVDSIKLGVIIAKSLAEIIGGKIEFVNEKGHGTRYFIKIKQKIVNNEKIGDIFASDAGKHTSSKDILNCTGLNVLVVDDSDINLKLASRYLQQFNFTVTAVTSGKDCIECVKNNNYHIIFIDHMMPDMDGVATVAGLNSLGKPLPPIIALTANSYEGLKEEYVNRGFSDYIQKPINFKELNKIINKFFKKAN